MYRFRKIFDNQCDVSSSVQKEDQVELSKEGCHVISRISRHVSEWALVKPRKLKLMYVRF